MADAVTEYQRLLFRHATDLEGYEDGLVLLLANLLAETERDLVDQIRRRLERLGEGPMSPRRLQRLELLLRDIRELRTQAWADFNKRMRQELFDFAKSEVAFAADAFEDAVGLEGIALSTPLVAQLRAAVFERPFRLNANDARTLAEFMAGIREQDVERITNAIRIGMLEGESIEQIVRRVRGTRAANYQDGVLALSQRNATTIVRTAVNHFSNAARATLWEGNDDIIFGLVWVAVLDRRTTLICQSRDGHVAPNGNNPIPRTVKLPRLQPPDARPPAHANCRSILVALLSPEGLIGNRPFVVERGSGRRITFGSAAARSRWANARIGQVPARTTYEQFIRNEDFDFMVEVYGRDRARLLRDGGLSLEDLVQRNGRNYSLAELRRRNAGAFRKANLN